MTLLAVALGVLVGLSLGALGGGGSTLAVPTLVFVGGLSAADATTTSLLVVGVASWIGAVGHARAGNVRLREGLAFGAAGVIGAYVGTSINRSIDESLLLLTFSALILVVAWRMYRSAQATPRCIEPVAEAASISAGSAVRTASRSPSAQVLSQRPVRVDEEPGSRATASPIDWAKLAAAATAVGALTGLFGVGGGFAVVPALTLLLGYTAKDAIGTSLVVITVNAAVALTMRWTSLELDWSLVVPFTVTVTLGVLLGSAVARRVAADRLVVGFSLMLAAVAIATAVGATLT